MAALPLSSPAAGARHWPIEVLVHILQARLLRAEGIRHDLVRVLLLLEKVVLSRVHYAQLLFQLEVAAMRIAIALRRRRHQAFLLLRIALLLFAMSGRAFFLRRSTIKVADLLVHGFELFVLLLEIIDLEVLLSS